MGVFESKRAESASADISVILFFARFKIFKDLLFLRAVHNTGTENILIWQSSKFKDSSLQKGLSNYFQKKYSWALFNSP